MFATSKASRGLIVAAGAATLLLAACSNSSSSSTTSSAAASSAAATSASASASGSAACDVTGKKVAFVMGAESDPFFQAMKVGATAEAQAKGMELIWQGDAKEYSPATQIPVVDQVLAQKPDALVLIPTDPKALQPSVAKAKAAGVIVANVDTRVENLDDVLTFITGDNADGGAKAAESLAGAIGYKDGTKYKVVVGLSSETATTNVARLEGFKKAIADKYPGIEIVDVAYSQSKPEVANTNINNWLTKYPDLNGIFAIDGTNAQGAAAALQAKGLTGKVALVGYDAYPDNVKLVKDGVITSLIAQVPADEAKQAIDAVADALCGNTAGIQKEVVIPNFTIDKNTTEADLKQYTYVA
ncbi:MAG: substrate-binding domain-containing protein [Actinomycetes bacterium]